MLRTLRIRNLAIIEDLTVPFEPGLNAFTGETGAGKSMLIDALGLVVGARADRGAVRHGAERAVVEALFDGFDDPAWAELADSLGFEPDDGQLLIRREIAAGGGHRILINGSPCTLAPLRTLGEQLLSVQGQHEAAGLARPERQLTLLDRFGGHGQLLEAVRAAHSALLASEQQRDALLAAREQRTTEQTRLQAILAEIDEVSPRPGELEQLNRERSRLRHAEELHSLSRSALEALHDAEPSAVGRVAEALRAAERLAEIDPDLSEIAQRLEAARLELQDLALTFRDGAAAEATSTPGRLESVERRRAAIERLLLHYGEDVEAVLAARQSAADRLEQLQDGGRALQALEAQIAAAEKGYAKAARALGRERKRAASRLEQGVAEQLGALALASARLKVLLEPATGRAVDHGRGAPVAVSPRGAERVAMRFAPNPGEPPAALGKIASGGELSRLLLALHVAGRGADEAVLIFDEVDAGVGGAVADAVGSRLASVAQGRQVLCVTHAPQVAAHASHHVHLLKRVERGRTRVVAEVLDRDQRIEELARMLGGPKRSRTSRDHAAELLGAAGRPVVAAERGGEV